MWEHAIGAPSATPGQTRKKPVGRLSPTGFYALSGFWHGGASFGAGRRSAFTPPIAGKGEMGARVRWRGDLRTPTPTLPPPPGRGVRGDGWGGHGGRDSPFLPYPPPAY